MYRRISRHLSYELQKDLGSVFEFEIDNADFTFKENKLLSVSFTIKYESELKTKILIQRYLAKFGKPIIFCSAKSYMPYTTDVYWRDGNIVLNLEGGSVFWDTTHIYSINNDKEEYNFKDEISECIEQRGKDIEEQNKFDKDGF